jgi:hypothetical protein
VRATGDRLTVVPADLGTIPAGQRSRLNGTYLRLRGYDYDYKRDFLSMGDPESARRAFEGGFLKLLPELISQSSDYSRLNQFAAILSLFRWARQSQSQFLGDLAKPPSTPTPAGIYIATDGFSPVPGFSLEGARRENRQNLEECIGRQTAQFPSSTQSILEDDLATARKVSTEIDAGDAEISLVTGPRDQLQFLTDLAIELAPANERGNLRKLELENDSQDMLSIVQKYLPARVASTLSSVDKEIDDYVQQSRDHFKAAAQTKQQLKSRSDLLHSMFEALGGTARDEYVRLGTAVKDAQDVIQSTETQLKKLREEFGEQCAAKLKPQLKARYRDLEDYEVPGFLEENCHVVGTAFDSYSDMNAKLVKTMEEQESKQTELEQEGSKLEMATFPNLEVWLSLRDYYTRPLSR